MWNLRKNFEIAREYLDALKPSYEGRRHATFRTFFYANLISLMILMVAASIFEDRAQARRNKTLQPIVAPFLSRMIPVSPPAGASAQLSRPYMIVKISEGAGSTVNGEVSCDGPPYPLIVKRSDVSEISTLILLTEEEIEAATYRNKGDGTTSTYRRIRYRLWAFDRKTGRLGAYTSMEDPALQPEYYNSFPGQIPYSDPCRWADSVTHIPS